jgi:hypothetical protein
MGMQGAATVPSLSEALAAAALTSQAATAPARPPALAAAAAPSRVPAHAAAALTAAALAAAALVTDHVTTIFLIHRLVSDLLGCCGHRADPNQCLGCQWWLRRQCPFVRGLRYSRPWWIG